MKIAIISDIHENFYNLRLALEEIEKREATQIICLGDLINPGIAKTLAESMIPVFSIWGNNDGDQTRIMRIALNKESRLTMSDATYDFLEFDGKKIFITHYPDLARPMAQSGNFDAVFYGHDHEVFEDKIGACLVANPGEISSHITGRSTFMIYDTTQNAVEVVELEKIVCVRAD